MINDNDNNNNNFIIYMRSIYLKNVSYNIIFHRANNKTEDFIPAINYNPTCASLLFHLASVR